MDHFISGIQRVEGKVRIRMKTCYRVLGLLFIALIILMSLPSEASANSLNANLSQQSKQNPASGSVQIMQALRSGRVHFTGNGIEQPGGNFQLTCSPTPCVLPNVQASEAAPHPVNEDPITTNPKNSLQLLTGSNDYNTYCDSGGFYASSNGGSTWNFTCMSVLPGYGDAGDPVLGYDLHNTAYIGSIDTQSSGAGVIAFQKSTNNGSSWSSPAVAINPIFSGGWVDKPWLQIDDTPTSPHANTVYISATQFSPGQTDSQISVTHSSNGGATWITSTVDAVQTLPAIDQWSDLAIGKDGTVYVSWLDCVGNGPTGNCGSTASTLMLSKSTDGGNTWSTPTTIAKVQLAPDTCPSSDPCFYGTLPNTTARVSDIPVIAIDNSSGKYAGHLYSTFYTWTGTYMKVEVATSINGGSTWSTPVGVAPATDTHDQFFPWVSVSASGTLGISWLDRRRDPKNISYEAFAALSTTGGSSFGANKQIASALSNPLNSGLSADFIGDYTGNIWAGKSLYVSWMDNRNGSVMHDEVGGYLV